MQNCLQNKQMCWAYLCLHNEYVLLSSLLLWNYPLSVNTPQDMENTTGSWDMYGVDDKKRYPDNQSKFFTQAADILSRREALRGFVALSKCSPRMTSIEYG